MRRIHRILLIVSLILGSSMLMGCPERVFNALGVGIVATDGSGEPTEILITDMGDQIMPCTGADESKIIIVNKEGTILWWFDPWFNVLNGAHTAELNASKDEMIISDTCHHRVLIISYPAGEVLWDDEVDCPELDLNHPNDAQFLENGNLLISDRDNHWVIEVDPAPDACNGTPDDGEIVWSFGVRGYPRSRLNFDDPTHLHSPHNVDRLPNGNTIIADSGEFLIGLSRVIEVNPAGQIVWSYKNYGDKKDCTIKGALFQACPALTWGRDAEVECAGEECETGLVTVTGLHQTVSVVRDLAEPLLPGEPHPRGREVIYQVEHAPGTCYDSDKIPQWDGDTNEGLGFFLVSNHGPMDLGNWLRVVPVDAGYSGIENIWELRGVQ